MIKAQIQLNAIIVLHIMQYLIKAHAFLVQVIVILVIMIKIQLQQNAIIALIVMHLPLAKNVLVVEKVVDLVISIMDK